MIKTFKATGLKQCTINLQSIFFIASGQAFKFKFIKGKDGDTRGTNISRAFVFKGRFTSYGF